MKWLKRCFAGVVGRLFTRRSTPELTSGNTATDTEFSAVRDELRREYTGGYSEKLVQYYAEGESTVPGCYGQIREGCVVESVYGESALPGRRKAKYVGQAYLLRKEAE